MSARTVVSPYLGFEMQLGDARDGGFPDADLVMTDPPWRYDQRIGVEVPYETLSTTEIRDVLVDTYKAAGRLVMWCTSGHMGEWLEASAGALGYPTTVGAWDKGPGRYGQGYHWAGRVELVLVYAKSGARNDRSTTLDSGYQWDPRGQSHSVKPVGWMKQMLLRWSKSNDLIVDPFMGHGSVRAAAWMANQTRSGSRRYVGREVDEARFNQAVEWANRDVSLLLKKTG